MKIVLATGGFDPIHSGHIAYINSASKLGERLIVALNSDEWLVEKKDSFFILNICMFRSAYSGFQTSRSTL